MLSQLVAVNTASGTPLPLTDPVYIFCILLLAIATAPLIAKLLRLPPLVVLIILGAILGSNVLGILARDSQLILLEKIGLLYIMLLAGLQMDLSKFRLVGARSLIFGLLTFGIPLTVGIVSGYWLTTSFLGSALLGILYSPHTLVSYPIVTVLGIVQKEAVAVAIGGTIVTSILTLSCLSIVQAIAGGSVGILLWIKLLILLPLLVLICLWGIPKFGRSFIFNQSIPSLSNQFIFILSSLFLTASAALLLGVDSIVGAFIAGLSLNPLIKNEKTLIERVEFVGNSLFIPAFLISVGILSNPRILFTHPENLGLALVVVAGAVGGKFLAAGIVGLAFRYSFAEVMTILGLTMSRAALVLVIALYGKQEGLLNEGLFNAIIFYILITCLIGPLVTNAFGKKVAGKY
ncbi:MAG: cation:proton antiporter [Chlorogloeopsis fritschii C42_A2020_084]|uniref:cation:proton antiporter n=1 Tax=Chlorogloeopsis fritschii TaxID=1124 RepID=UPI001A062D1F|nr:cation:proton antiporter [Chlorogloeopsis fritschii]MBF2005146.1 cation:proton antiporter [Chlorogloeopsis fritschii C42_A2020_084]